jgi:hypothetical protein
MDKEILVANGDLEIEGLVVQALSQRQIPVTAVDWVWVPQFEAAQLVVVTDLYDSKGPLEANARILEALHLAGVYQRFAIRELYVMSPSDPLAQELVRQLRTISEGTIHISRANGRGAPGYSIVFTPYLGRGGPIPSVWLGDENELRVFLEQRLRIAPNTIDQAVLQLQQKKYTSIFNVQMNLRRAKKLHLAA